MKIGLCLFVFTLLISLDIFSQSTPANYPVAQYATAYITQPSNSKSQPSIKVVYETGESEIILLEKYASSEEREAGGKKFSATALDNQITITTFINDLAKKKYSLKDMEYEVSSHNTYYTVLIFEKIVMMSVDKLKPE